MGRLPDDHHKAPRMKRAAETLSISIGITEDDRILLGFSRSVDAIGLDLVAAQGFRDLLDERIAHLEGLES